MKKFNKPNEARLCYDSRARLHNTVKAKSSICEITQMINVVVIHEFRSKIDRSARYNNDSIEKDSK